MSAIAPRPGFDWLKVDWGAPDQARADRCSYCGDPFPADDDSGFVPLILGNEAGWVAEFCDHCQAAWFGIETFPDPPDDADFAAPEPDPELPELGPCCMCERRDGVRNMILLDRRGAVPGRGWGCVVCGLPPDGAVAVLCDDCLARYRLDQALLKVACRGYPARDGRIAIAALPPEPFEHDPAAHGEPA